MPRTNKAKEADEYGRNRTEKLEELITDLWWFIENVNDDTPNRTERFFALRERVRDIYGR